MNNRGRGKLNQQERARLKRIADAPSNRTSCERSQYRYGADRPTEDRLLDEYTITDKGEAVVDRWRQFENAGKKW